jgi:hypothetical protein
MIFEDKLICCCCDEATWIGRELGEQRISPRVEQGTNGLSGAPRNENMARNTEND